MRRHEASPEIAVIVSELASHNAYIFWHQHRDCHFIVRFGFVRFLQQISIFFLLAAFSCLFPAAKRSEEEQREAKRFHVLLGLFIIIRNITRINIAPLSRLYWLCRLGDNRPRREVAHWSRRSRWWLTALKTAPASAINIITPLPLSGRKGFLKADLQGLFVLLRFRANYTNSWRFFAIIKKVTEANWGRRLRAEDWQRVVLRAFPE